MIRQIVLVTILAGVLIHFMVFPPRAVNEKFSRQLCLECGISRELKETFVEKKKTTEEELLKENFISSYTIALNGPCVTHDWDTFSGSSFEYRSGLAYYFSMKSSDSFSGSAEAYIPSIFSSGHSLLEKRFAKYYKENPEFLQRLIKIIFNTMKMNKEEKFEELMSVFIDNSGNFNKLKIALDDFERNP